jgi:23S rRNA (pseudouridine1915-N3)-methyltransferase
MKITIFNPGATQDAYLKEGIAIFEKRLQHYSSFKMVYLTEPKNLKSMSEQAQRDAEGKVILSAIGKVDHPVLLDIGGKQLSSEGFAKYMQQCMNKGIRHLGFIIGGPFGFSDEVYNAVQEKLSVSSMTFSHQLIRLIFLEQLYRAFTILKGEPYHHA